MTWTVDASAHDAAELSVDPSEGLVDGQIVHVHITNALPRERVLLSACLYVGNELSCMENRELRVLPSGEVRPFAHRVRAVLDTPAGRVDCRTTDRTRPCVLALRLADNTDARGRGPALDLAPLAFLPDAPLEPAPTLTVSPATGLRDRTMVTVRGQGFDVAVRTGARLCRAGTTAPNACQPAGRPPITTESGTFYQDVTVYAGFGTLDGDWVDCTSPGACELVVFQGRAGSPPARTPLRFAEGQVTVRPAITLDPAGALRDGQRVLVSGTGFDAGATISLQQYVVRRDGANVWHELLDNTFLSATADGAFTQTVTVREGPAGSSASCKTARCMIAASELQGRYGSAQTTLLFGSDAATDPI